MKSRYKIELQLGDFAAEVDRRLEQWCEENMSVRLWQKDPTIWVTDAAQAAETAELGDRLGWLELPQMMASHVDELQQFAAKVGEDGFRSVVLLGMGGSSLAPEVLMKVFGQRDGYPGLTVLDSTHVDSVQRTSDAVNLAKTLFLVSSKSGTTIETLSLFHYFYTAVSRVKKSPGENFVSITDPGSKLEAMAKELGMRHNFSSPPDVGGRYSALTYFGLLPAALIGLDVAELLTRAQGMAHQCGQDVTPYDNPGMVLGAVLGELALAGKNKLTLFASPQIAPFVVWIEQLIAESTGKDGKGILPVVDERVGEVDEYGRDRLFVYLRLDGDNHVDLDKTVDKLRAASYPVVTLHLEDKQAIAAEFFRFEVATALAGAIMEIHPFNQPNVEAAKHNAKALMGSYQRTGQLPEESPTLTEGDVEVYGGGEISGDSVIECLENFLSQVELGDYLALMAYLPANEATHLCLQQLRLVIRQHYRLATTLGYGPRFLHSTGQLHKGDANQGLFVQITQATGYDVNIPGQSYGFATLIQAQAQGDYQALKEAGRRVLRLHLRNEPGLVLQDLLQSFTNSFLPERQQ